MSGDESKTEPAVMAAKYTNDGSINEAILLAGKPCFVRYNRNGDYEIVATIQEPSRTIRPPSEGEYAYEPYRFKDKAELDAFVKKAQTTNIDSLYGSIRARSSMYIHQDPRTISFLAAMVTFSYLQDRFGTCPYLAIVGGNSTGKTSIGLAFNLMGYRCIKATSVSAPNYFRSLGPVEPGQCTIVEDEADGIDKDREKMAILKTGYERTGRVPRVNMNHHDQQQSWFYTYGLKVIICENTPDANTARGYLDRTFVIRTTPGHPPYNIKEVMALTSHAHAQQRAEIEDLRKTLLMYRMRNFYKSMPDIETGLENREEELCKPLLQLFFGTSHLQEITQALQFFLMQKREVKTSSIDGVLLRAIVEAVQEYGVVLTVGQIWDKITEALPGDYLYPSRHDAYHAEGIGIIYRNTISKICVDRLGAISLPTHGKGRSLKFSQEKLDRLNKDQTSMPLISPRLKEEDGKDGSGPSEEGTTSSPAKLALSTHS